MLAEDYVSYETAKLLKEKEFDEPCECFYDTEHNDISIVNGWMNVSNSQLEEREFLCYSAPTLQMAMKWLRRVHGLHIAILWDCGAYIGKNTFCYHIDDMGNYENKGLNKIGFESYEEACEEAIKYCLENLI